MSCTIRVTGHLHWKVNYQCLQELWDLNLPQNNGGLILCGDHYLADRHETFAKCEHIVDVP